MNSFSEFWHNFITAGYSLDDFFSGLKRFGADVGANENFRGIWSGIASFLSRFEFLIPFLLLGLALLVLFLGERMFPVVRRVAFFLGGFILGVHFLANYILLVVPFIPPWGVGIIIGIVASVLPNALYLLAYILIPSYGVYAMLCGGMIPALRGNYLVGALGAVLTAVTVFLLRRYLEMGALSLIGAFGVVCVIRTWYDFTRWPMFGGVTWLAVLIATLILGLFGFLVQFRIRKKDDSEKK